YKITDVELIPEGWEVRGIKDIAPLQRGFDLPTSKIRKGAHPVVYSNGVLAHHSMFMVKGPGVVTGRSGTIGNVHFVEEDFWPHNTSLWVTSFKGNDPKFVFYLLQTIGIERFSTGSGVPTLNRNDVHSHLVAISTSSAEQDAIATALSDVDALIALLEKLITKKRDIKQGAMQELLTGKQRLPEFNRSDGKLKQTEVGVIPEDWDIAEVRKITRSHKQGYYTKDRYVDKGVRLVRITDLMNPLIDFAAMPMLHISKCDFDLYKVKIGDFLFARSGAIGRYGIVYEDVEAIFGSYIIRFTFDSNKVKNEYFGFLYETEVIWKQLSSITQGSSNININASNIKSIKMPLPPIEEQCAITAVLSDMDAELKSLEQRLAKTRALKQGMMQELLTGRTRLV
ncbi:MAG: hypothetical protein A2W28_06620, partial [Gammaproteobacteria bacterium RBG_16_51_14]